MLWYDMYGKEMYIKLSLSIVDDVDVVEKIKHASHITVLTNILNQFAEMPTHIFCYLLFWCYKQQVQQKKVDF